MTIINDLAPAKAAITTVLPLQVGSDWVAICYIQYPVLFSLLSARHTEETMFGYDESSGILTIGTGEDAQTFLLPKEKYDALLALDLDEATLAKFARTLGALVKKQTTEQANKAEQDYRAEVERCAAIILTPKVTAALERFRAETAQLGAKYGIESLKPQGGENEDGTFRFTAKSAGQFDALARDYDGVRGVKCEDGVNWEGNFDAPLLYAKTSALRGLSVALAGLANQVNDERGNPAKTVDVHFDADGKVAWGKSANTGNGSGGSVAGRQNAIGYRVGDKQYRNVSEVCVALGIDTQGVKYPQKAAAFLTAVKSGKVAPVYKSV